MIKKWYDGYDFDTIGAIYNPYSVMEAVKSGDYSSHWRKTSAAENLITYINELNDSGDDIPMPGLLIPVSPGSVPVNDKERERIRKLDEKDIMIPASYMELAREIMCHGHDVPEKYLATAHGDFRNAPMTHFYYGSHETLYAFAPSYAASYKKAGAECVIHVGKGMHHCYALQYFIPGCKPAFDEIMRLINDRSII